MGFRIGRAPPGGPIVFEVPSVSRGPDQAEFVFAKAAAQRSATMVQVLALAGAAACMTLAALLQEPIHEKRIREQIVLVASTQPGGQAVSLDLPPKYAWVAAAGGTFRGIATDILWMRADKLKEEGKYYESHQLAKWICTLTPRFPTVWSFQAWNMSYNISVATHTTAERWQWVYNGIRLLRDEGIPNNPKIVGLYHQIAWTWFHKVGDRMDDYHWKYKRIWAATMEVLLGPPPVGLSDEQTIDWFRPVAQAPASLDAVVKAHPGVAGLVKQLADLGVDVHAETAVTRVYHPLEERFFKPYTAWMLEQKAAALRAKPAELEPKTAKLAEFFAAATTEQNRPDFEALLAWMRAKVLREQYKMDPKFMLDLTARLETPAPIPIDWRTPFSQSLYWAMYGTDKGREVKTVKEFDLLNTDRIMLFSLGALARGGSYVFRPNLDDYSESFLDSMPDFRYVEAVHRMCISRGKLYPEEGEVIVNTAGEMFRAYHVNTLRSFVVNLHYAGRDREAQRYFDYLVANYKSLTNGQEIDTAYRDKTFEEFIKAEEKEIVDNYQELRSLLASLMQSAHVYLASGRGDLFDANMSKARQLYDEYQKDRTDEAGGRRALPPYEVIRANNLAQFVTDPTWPLLLRTLVWSNEREEFKRWAYDYVKDAVAEACAAEGYDVTKAFPEPPGMEQFRAAHPADSPEDVAAETLRKQKEERLKAENK